VHALRWGDQPIWGLQAHPEITPDTALTFLRVAGERWPAAAELFTRAAEGPVRDSESGRALVQRFIAS
jgi:GMP synthase-like glutamine amidotransferase